MNSKGTSVWEQHIEYAVLGIAVLVLGWFAWGVFSSSIQVKSGSRVVTTGNVNAELLTAAQNLNPQLKWSEKLSFGFQFRLDDVDLPEGEFSSKVSKIEINYNFNNNWLTRTTIQYDSIRDVLSANFRLNWIHRAGDDLFLVFNTIRRGDLTDRGIILKYTHSFDF